MSVRLNNVEVIHSEIIHSDQNFYSHNHLIIQGFKRGFFDFEEVKNRGYQCPIQSQQKWHHISKQYYLMAHISCIMATGMHMCIFGPKNLQIPTCVVMVYFVLCCMCDIHVGHSFVLQAPFLMCTNWIANTQGSYSDS